MDATEVVPGASELAEPDGITARLSAFLAASRWDDVPAAVRHEAKRSLLNFFATALAGCRDPAIGCALDVLSEFSDPSQKAVVIGRSETTDLLNAAFLNAASANVFDFDDTHLRTVIHPSAPVAPAVLALAGRRPIAGSALLHAFILGIETECRIGNSVSPGHYRRGWHITATCGIFGAAAAAAKLLDLSKQKICWAFGNASAQSSGLVETLGSMAKSIGVGNAARNGVLAALLAEKNFTGPDRPIEGPFGFARVTSEDPALSCIIEGLGESWEILKNTYKPYPCGIVVNPVIEACLDLRVQHDHNWRQSRRIVVTGNPLLRERADRPAVATGREAQVSAQHAVAVALLYGAAGIAQFTDTAVSDPAARELRRKVQIVADETVPIEAAKVAVEMSDGSVKTTQVRSARGSLARPLSDAELEKKFLELAAYGCPGCDAARLITAIWTIDRSDHAGNVMRLAVPRT